MLPRYPRYQQPFASQDAFPPIPDDINFDILLKQFSQPGEDILHIEVDALVQQPDQQPPPGVLVENWTPSPSHPLIHIDASYDDLSVSDLDTIQPSSPMVLGMQTQMMIPTYQEVPHVYHQEAPQAHVPVIHEHVPVPQPQHPFVEELASLPQDLFQGHNPQEVMQAVMQNSNMAEVKQIMESLPAPDEESKVIYKAILKMTIREEVHRRKTQSRV